MKHYRKFGTNRKERPAIIPSLWRSCVNCHIIPFSLNMRMYHLIIFVKGYIMSMHGTALLLVLLFLLVRQ